jgi:hypothetical protein
MVRYSSPHRAGVAQSGADRVGRSCSLLAGFADSLRLVLRPTAKRWGVDSGFDCFAACIAFGLFGSRC